MCEDIIELYFRYTAREGGSGSGSSLVTVFDISTFESSGSVIKQRVTWQKEHHRHKVYTKT